MEAASVFRYQTVDRFKCPWGRGPVNTSPFYEKLPSLNQRVWSSSLQRPTHKSKGFLGIGAVLTDCLAAIAAATRGLMRSINSDLIKFWRSDFFLEIGGWSLIGLGAFSQVPVI